MDCERRGRAVKDKATTEKTGDSMSKRTEGWWERGRGAGTRDGALPPVITELRTLATVVGGRGRWCGWWDGLRGDTKNMLETLYLSMCLQKGPNSPREPINLEEWDRVSQGQAEDSKEEGWRAGNRWESKREKEGKKDGVRPEGSDERSSWFMFLCLVFPVILSPVIWIFFCNSQDVVDSQNKASFYNHLTNSIL